MALNANRVRMMNERANHDVDTQCKRYETESKSTKNYKIPKDKIDEYLKSPDKDLFLLQFGKCEVINEI